MTTEELVALIKLSGVTQKEIVDTVASIELALLPLKVASASNEMDWQEKAATLINSSNYLIAELKLEAQYQANESPIIAAMLNNACMMIAGLRELLDEAYGKLAKED